MKRKIINDLVIDIDNVPENFEELVTESFKEFTSGTNPDFMLHDQLYYIDCVLRNLHFADDVTKVHDLIKNTFKYQLDEYGDIMDRSEFLTVSFMYTCYNAGRKDSALYSYEFTNRDRNDNEKIMKILFRVIKTVIGYKDERKSKV